MSTLTHKDLSEIYSTLYVLENRDFDCNQCQARFISRPDGEAMLAKVKAVRNCTKIGQHVGQTFTPGPYQVNYRKCVGNYFSQSALNWIEAYGVYDKGVMPMPGSFMDQPNKAIECLKTIGLYRLRQQQIAREKVSRETKGLTRRGR